MSSKLHPILRLKPGGECSFDFSFCGVFSIVQHPSGINIPQGIQLISPIPLGVTQWTAGQTLNYQCANCYTGSGGVIVCQEQNVGGQVVGRWAYANPAQQPCFRKSV